MLSQPDRRYQSFLVDGDAGGPAMRLAERLLHPVAGRLAVRQLLPGHALRPLPIDRIPGDHTGLAPLGRGHGAYVVGIEPRLAGGNGDQAAGRYRVGYTIV